MVTKAKLEISKPKIYLISASDIYPTNFKEDLSNLAWYDAMKSKFNALVLNNTWTFTNPPLVLPLLDVNEYFCKKYTSWIWFQLDLNLVIKPPTISVKAIMSHAITLRWFIHQIDINNGFLNGDLQENIFMQQPLGFVSSNLAQVCNLITLFMALSKY